MPVNKKTLKIIEETEQLSRMLFGDKMFDFYLYGSYAKGDYNKYSDIDLLITLDLTDN